MKPQLHDLLPAIRRPRHALFALAVLAAGLAPAVNAEESPAAPMTSTQDQPPIEGSPPDPSAAPDQAVPGAPPAGSPRAPRNHRPRSAAERLNEHVQALTQALNLDAKQQKAMREILIQERVAILKLRNGQSQDVVAASASLKGHTREQIRALLNEAQRKKFFADVPDENLAPAHADRDYWIEQTQPRPAAAAANPVAAAADPAGKSRPAGAADGAGAR